MGDKSRSGAAFLNTRTAANNNQQEYLLTDYMQMNPKTTSKDVKKPSAQEHKQTEGLPQANYGTITSTFCC